MKIIYKLGIFVLLLTILIALIFNAESKPDIIKDAINWKFDPTQLIELNSLVKENINNSALYIDVFGFNRPVLVEHNFNQTFLTSRVHSISIWGYFDHEGTFHALDYRMSHWQIIKYITSFIGFIWFIFIFFKEFKLTRRGFEENA